MDKELLELFESAKKAADAAAADGVSVGGSEETRCVDALKELKKFPVTMQVLVKTQVGKRLRPLTKHPRKKIQAVASDLLELWKRIVLDETKSKNNGSSHAPSSMKGDVAKAETVKVEKVQKLDSLKGEKFSRADTTKIEKAEQSGTVINEKAESVKVEKTGGSVPVTVKVEKTGGSAPVKVEKIIKEETKVTGNKRPLEAPKGPPKLTSMIKCNDSMRDKYRELIAEALSKVSEEAEEDSIEEVNARDPIRMAVSVESVMFEKLGASNGTQKYKYRSLLFNIKDPKNPDLRRKILLGEIKPERLVSMTPEEMASEQRKKENNQIKEKALFDCERGGPPKATTDAFRCGRCGQRKTTYYQMQTRSADEPMTTYVTCVNCNNHWKFC